jgi:hypothetical protein
MMNYHFSDGNQTAGAFASYFIVLDTHDCLQSFGHSLSLFE